MPYNVYVSHDCLSFDTRREARKFAQGLFDNSDQGNLFITNPRERVIERYTRDGVYK